MNPSAFSVIDQYLLERDQSQSVLTDKGKMNIDQQVPAAHPQVCSTSGGFVTVSSGQTFSCNSTVQPALAPSPPSSSSSPSSCCTPPRLVSPSSLPPCWGGLMDLLPGPSPACALTQVCDQQVQPEDSRFLMDMDTTNFYETPLHYSGCYTEERMDGYPSKSADPFMMPPLVKVEPQELQGDAVGEEEVELVSELKQQIINEISSDIAHDCAVLQICNDPRQWSVEDVRSWIDWTASRQLLTNVRLANFTMNGSVLYNMEEEEFVRCDPANGGNLFTRLSFWKLVQSNKDREVRETRNAFNKAYSALNSPVQAPCSPSSIISRDSCGDSQTPDTDSSNDGCRSPVPPSRAPLVTSQDDDLRLPEGSEHKQTIHLWQFLKELLMAGDYYQRCIKWLDRSQGIFKIEDSVKVAKLWGKRKNRPAMNYDKLSRSIRQYYKKGIIKKTTHSKRLVYQFCAPYL